MRDINPNEKQSQSQGKMILSAMLNVERLTQLEAYRRFGCTRLGARIYDLTNQGYRIERKMITVPSGKRVMQYWIDVEVVE